MSTTRLVSVLFVLLLLLMGVSIISTACTESEQAQIQTVAAEAGQTAVAEGVLIVETQGAQLIKTGEAEVATSAVQLRETVEARPIFF